MLEQARRAAAALIAADPCVAVASACVRRERTHRSQTLPATVGQRPPEALAAQALTAAEAPSAASRLTSGVCRYWRLRCSYDHALWSAWAVPGDKHAACMTALSQAMLFLSSYSPLLAVFALLNTFGKGPPSLVCVVLAVVGVACLPLLFVLNRSTAAQPVRVATATPRDGDVLACIASYLVPFASIDAHTARERTRSESSSASSPSCTCGRRCSTSTRCSHWQDFGCSRCKPLGERQWSCCAVAGSSGRTAASTLAG